MTGANLNPSNRGKKGGLTGSKHFIPIELETAQQTPVIAPQQKTTDKPRREQTQNHSIKQDKSNRTTDTHSKTLEDAKVIAVTYGVTLTDIKSHMQASNDTVDEALGEGISVKEANERKLRIARQNNLIEVRGERIKQKRKLATNYGEELALLGETIDNATKGVTVAKKLINYQTEVTDFHTAQSKLEEHEELYLQQAIRTQGVKNLTAGIQEEWQLKLEKQETVNDALFLEIETSDKRNEQRRLDMEAFLLSD